MYRKEDIEAINLNIDNIKDEAEYECRTKNDPTLEEMSNVYGDIMDYIRKNNVIAYGGFAQNLLIGVKDKEKEFYKRIGKALFNWPKLADIEFYSSTPVKHVIELTEMLRAKKHPYISSEGGVHEGTYKIFVNFENYCDISYMPTIVFNTVPTTTIDGIKCVSPYFMGVDAFRVMTDPMTSYWRLEKSINRFQTMFELYKLSEMKQIDSFDNLKKIFGKVDEKAIRLIRKSIVHKSQLIVVGTHAYDYYMGKIKGKKIGDVAPYYLISIDLDKDFQKISKILKEKYPNRITIKSYHPYYEFIDKRHEFYLDGVQILKLYGNNGRCIVFYQSEKKYTKFGTFNLIMLYNLFEYFNSITHNKDMIGYYGKFINNFINIKNKWLTENSKTVTDKSIFQDFTFTCIGQSFNPIRESRLEMIKKKKEGKRFKFRYEPSGKPPEKLPEFSYPNTSGNEIKKN